MAAPVPAPATHLELQSTLHNRPSRSSQVHKNSSQIHLTSHKLCHNRFNNHICSSRKFITHINNFSCQINSHKIYNKIDAHKNHKHWTEFDLEKKIKKLTVGSLALVPPAAPALW
jgi:CRISPR/Cas system CMR-associated protein Cmr1 (group 7 of RAMP superfamily)